MKRSAVSIVGPRRSKRLAKMKSNRIKVKEPKDAKGGVTVPSVVSLSDDSSRRPVGTELKKSSFPKEMKKKVEETLTHVTRYIQGSSINAGEVYQAFKSKESIFHVLKFALSDKEFLAKDKTGRESQEELVDDLCWDMPLPLSRSNCSLGYFGTLVEVLITRPDIVPPRSISFLHSNNLLYEDDIETSTEASLDASFKEMLCNKGKETVHSIESLLPVIEALLQHEPEMANQASAPLIVLKHIVHFWVTVLEEGKWDASHDMLHEQLENVNCAFDFARKFQMDTKNVEVKTVLLKLVLYFSFAIEWPRESCSKEERRELERLAKILRS